MRTGSAARGPPRSSAGASSSTASGSSSAAAPDPNSPSSSSSTANGARSSARSSATSAGTCPGLGSRSARCVFTADSYHLLGLSLWLTRHDTLQSSRRFRGGGGVSARLGRPELLPQAAQQPALRALPYPLDVICQRPLAVLALELAQQATGHAV